MKTGHYSKADDWQPPVAEPLRVGHFKAPTRKADAIVLISIILIVAIVLVSWLI